MNKMIVMDMYYALRNMMITEKKRINLFYFITKFLSAYQSNRNSIYYLFVLFGKCNVVDFNYERKFQIYNEK